MIAAQRSECQSGQEFQDKNQRGLNGESNHDSHNGSHVCSEC